MEAPRMMDDLLKEYSKFTGDYAIYPEASSGSERELAYLALGLAGETGEAIDVIKKVLRDSPNGFTVERYQKWLLELGDLFWYFDRLLAATGLTLEQVIQANMEKLKKRMEEGTVKDETKRLES